jgi:hypothetical protein
MRVLPSCRVAPVLHVASVPEAECRARDSQGAHVLDHYSGVRFGRAGIMVRFVGKSPCPREAHGMARMHRWGHVESSETAYYSNT